MLNRKLISSVLIGTVASVMMMGATPASANQRHFGHGFYWHVSSHFCSPYSNYPCYPSFNPYFGHKSYWGYGSSHGRGHGHRR
jgi:hypothetical protein